jgi:hypothetical protein
MTDKYQIYRDAELGGRVGFGDDPAILVVDFRRSFVDPAVPGGGDFTDAFARTPAWMVPNSRFSLRFAPVLAMSQLHSGYRP